MSKKEPRGTILVLIGALKLFKAALLVVAGVGLLRLLRAPDMRAAIETFVRHFRVDPGNVHIHRLLEHVVGIKRSTLRTLEVGTFIYAALFIIEGTGLVLRKRWAEYVTVVSTSLFLPLEVFEVVLAFSNSPSLLHPPVTRIAALLINAAVVAYLVYRLRQPLPVAPPEPRQEPGDKGLVVEATVPPKDSIAPG